MRKPRVFIGSSTEQLELAEKVELWLDEQGCEPRLWTGVFESGDYALTSLLTEAKGCDGAIFIFGETDKSWFRDSELKAPRDNVVYELGLFTGAADVPELKRVVFCRVGSSKVASDLSGIAYIYIDPDDPYRAKTKNEIRLYAGRLNKFVSHSPPDDLFKITTKQELFNAGTDLIEDAASSITLAAKTPVPIMGPRPYSGTKKYSYEQKQYDVYWEIIEKASKGNISFTLISSLHSISDDLISYSDSLFRDEVINNILKLYDFASKSTSKISIYWHEGIAPPAFLVTQDNTLLWWKGGNGDSIWVSHKSNQLADALASSNSDNYNSFSCDEVLETLKGMFRV